MSVEQQTVTQIQVDNVMDYASYIAQVANIQLGDGLPDGTTVTFIDPSALENAQVLDPTTLEIQGAIQIPTSVNIEHVILEQPILEQLTGLQSVVASGGDTLALTAAVDALPIIEAGPGDIKPPVGKGPYSCSHCEKVFNKYGQLQRHLKTHDEDKPYRCMQCSASFNMEDNLRLHVATHVPEDGEPTCPECHKKFSRIASLKAHIMVHEKEENLMCPECGDEFSVQTQLDRHMNEHRQEEVGTRSYGCRQCAAEYPRLSQLREHMKQHYKIKASLSHRTYKRNIDRTGFNHRCKHCSKSFQKPSQLVRHERIHTGERPFQCSICTKTFNQKGALQVHMTKHTGERSHVCQFCPATFAQKGNLRAHIHRVHTLNNTADQTSYQCDECSCVFKKLGSLNAHMSRAHSDPSVLTTQVEVGGTGEEDKEVEGGMMLFDLEQVPGSENGQLSAHDPDVREAVQAAQLHDQGSNMAGASDILQQALENSGLTGRVPESVQEAAMPAGSTTSSGLVSVSAGVSRNTMMMTVHDSVTGITKKHLIRKVNGVRWHQCTYCSKEFKKPSDLVRHIRIHTHEKPYKCTQCYRAFAVKSTLTAHIKTHSGVKDYRCEECNKLFSTQGSLKVHLRLHTGAKPFDCQHCDKKFRTSAHRKSHVMSHFRDPNNPHPRPRRVFKRAARNDMLQDIPMQEPILITDTGLIQQMPRHSMLQHYVGEGSSVDRPYKCAYCQRGFKKSSHLKQHIRSHTGEKPFRCVQCLHSFVSSGVLKAHTRTHSGVKNYKCVVCDTAFTTNGSLKRHMSTHSEVRPFMCPYCQKTFKTSVNCKKHMKTHRHEVSMQSLQDVGQSVGPDVVEEVGVVDNEESVTTGNDADLGHPQATATLSALQPADIGSATTISHHDLHTSGLTDAFGNSALDQTLQQTLNQQVFDQQTSFSQTFPLSGQQGFAQLNSQLNPQLHHQLTQPLTSAPLNPPTLTSTGLAAPIITTTQPSHLLPPPPLTAMPQNQLTFQTQQLDMGGLNSGLLQQAAPNATMQTMTAILQPGETDQEVLEETGTEELPVTESVEAGVTYSTVFKCSLCDKVFTKDSDLKDHLISHTVSNAYKCNKCESSFSSRTQLKYHQKTHGGGKGELHCTVCQATFTSNAVLTRHMQSHRGQQYKCPLCPQLFRSSLTCKRHVKQFHGKAVVQEVDENLAPQQNQTVELVEMEGETTLQSLVDKHGVDENLTVSERIFIESTSEKDRISEIKDNTHQHVEGEPCSHASQCQRCQAHRCQHCNKSFKKPSDLQRHIRIHTGEKPFQCHLCQRSFTVKSTLDSHMRTHKPSEKQFHCHVCGSMFSTKGSLKVHMRLHTGAKPFKCPHCSQRFRTSGHRKSHMLSHFKQDAPRTKRGASKRQAAALEQQQVQQQQVQQAPLIVFNTADATAQQVGLAGQVVNIDQSLLSGQNIMPMSLAVPDNIATQVAGDGTSQILQNLVESLQLLTGALPPGVQLTGVETGPGGNLLSQTVQIDASLLQQLQQQGNINITINSQILAPQGTPAAADPNLVQALQLAPTTLPEAVNPNIIVQQPMVSMATVNAPDLDPSLVQASTVTAMPQGHDPNAVGAATYVTTPIAEDVQMVNNAQNVILVEGGETRLVQEEGEEEEEEEEEEEGEVEGLVGRGGLECEGVTLKDEVMGVEREGDEDDLLTQAIKNNPEKNFLCAICLKPFKESSELNEHLQTHHPVTPSQAPSKRRSSKAAHHHCKECDKEFKKPSQLQRHMRIHTGERPFVCTICKKAFNQKNALNIHLQKHSGEKPHQCSYCDAAFTQRGNLKTHIKRAHHVDMVQSMNLPKAYSTLTNVDSAAVEMVSVTAASGGEPSVTGGVEGDLYLNDVADLL